MILAAHLTGPSSWSGLVVSDGYVVALCTHDHGSALDALACAQTAQDRPGEPAVPIPGQGDLLDLLREQGPRS